MEKIIVRFAPSPTGYLHLGGARTALYNFLYARHKGGIFRLRIEDTDRERSTKESTDAILDAMKWLGLDWDDEVVFQSERTDIYKEHLKKLEEEGRAYRCYCKHEDLEAQRKKTLAEGKSWRYPGTCREIKEHLQGVPYVLRLKMPLEGETMVDDLILGPVTVPNKELGDWVLTRSDGSPLYNFVCVVDDTFMKITHVIRGVDHLDNTKRQVHLYHALGYKPPKFAHLPLIAGLSKREGSDSVQKYRDDGLLPEAVINYITRMGWGYKDQEIFSMKELIEHFDIADVTKSQSQVNPKKLLWLNSHYIKEGDNERISNLVKPFLTKIGINTDEIDFGLLKQAVKTMQPRARTLIELAEGIKFYFLPESGFSYDEESVKKFLKPELKELLTRITNYFEGVNDFVMPELEENFKKFIEKESIELKEIAQPLRVSVTGKAVGPGLFETFEVLGKNKVINRLKNTINNKL